MTDDDSDMIQKSAVAEHARLVRASVLHLLDLKRGNYSPRFTELKVDLRDRVIAQPMRRPTQWPRPAPKPFSQTMLLRRRQRL